MKKLLWNIFNKRINRVTYLAGVLIYASLFFAISDVLLVTKSSSAKILLIELAIWFIIFILTGILSQALTVRRWHDVTGENWMGILWWKTSIMGLGIWPLWNKGQSNTNKFGKPPKPGIDWKGLFGF